jgi:tRNA A37 methylthiotransferase MiaB
MAGQVPEPVRRERSGRLLALAAEARGRRAAGRVGSTAAVLLEMALGDGRWIGHAEDHVLVVVPATARPLDNAIAHVALTDVDRDEPERLVGEILSVSPGRSLRTRAGVRLPVLAAGGAA